MFDSILCGLLVAHTDGLLLSPYCPLLFAIISIALLLRLPRRHLVATLTVALLVIGGLIARCFLQLFYGWPDNFRVSAALLWSMFVSVCLTIGSAYQQFQFRTQDRDISAAFVSLAPFAIHVAALKRAVVCGMKAFADDIGRNPRVLTLSQVHDSRTIIGTIDHSGYSTHSERGRSRAVGHCIFDVYVALV